MALNISGKIAGFVFTVVVPLVVAAMIPHISVGAGIPIIAVSIVIGLGLELFPASLEKKSVPNSWVGGWPTRGGRIRDATDSSLYEGIRTNVERSEGEGGVTTYPCICSAHISVRLPHRVNYTWHKMEG
jgi:hypothetical protein